VDTAPGRDVRYLVLDALQDDIEEVPNVMRMLAEWRTEVEAEFTRADVVAALRDLLDQDLVAAYEESAERPELVHVGNPTMTDEAMERYWFQPTAKGTAAWKAWDSAL
jgi:hypothetical protein